jgi:hypothetical protein
MSSKDSMPIATDAIMPHMGTVFGVSEQATLLFLRSKWDAQNAFLSMNHQNPAAEWSAFDQKNIPCLEWALPSRHGPDQA